jgi:hypothetical protein
MCTWNQTWFQNWVQKFLNLKKCDRIEIKGFKFRENLAQTHTWRRIVTSIFKCQNRDQRFCLKRRTWTTLLLMQQLCMIQFFDPQWYPMMMHGHHLLGTPPPSIESDLPSPFVSLFFIHIVPVIVVQIFNYLQKKWFNGGKRNWHLVPTKNTHSWGHCHNPSQKLSLVTSKPCEVHFIRYFFLWLRFKVL